MEGMQNNNQNENLSKAYDGLKKFLGELIELKSTTNEEGTIQSIKDNISMKGHNAWILVFSIIVASVGLNSNSTAVVIGAMLISPLMGPILGIGLSIGINDVLTLRKSLMNLGVMVGLSLITSFLFFSIPLFQDSTSELLARTRPDIRDVLIALSGGLALIVALTRPSPQFNTVAGVAIATALMPPLCTAGYSLALGNFKYFFGAMFLFSINCVFIALATFTIVKYLGFRMVNYINSQKRKRIARIASFVAFIIVLGSIYTFYTFILERSFNHRAHVFITELKDNGIAILGDEKKNVDYTKKIIRLPLLGDIVSNEEIERWKTRMVDLGLGETQLKVIQNDDTKILNEVTNLKELYSQNHQLIMSKDEALREKDRKIERLQSKIQKNQSDKQDFNKISKEISLVFPEMKELSFYNKFNTNFSATDTIPVFEFSWDSNIDTTAQSDKNKRLAQWLKFRMELDTLVLNNK